MPSPLSEPESVAAPIPAPMPAPAPLTVAVAQPRCAAPGRPDTVSSLVAQAGTEPGELVRAEAFRAEPPRP
ncbi:hypothetical protein ACFQ6N_07630 [Kitasatospora sp. NPDC056446]|uniref:hypothetical protein n=1 Tax=Kitasatospora sp. NPDC056446 TaxID=3345819 RepID=UPI0036A679D3